MTETRLKQDLDLVRGRLFAAITGIGEDQFKRRPPKQNPEAKAVMRSPSTLLGTGSAEHPEPVPIIDTPWSIAEILAHLLASERIQAGRIRAALDEDGAAVAPVPADERADAARAGRMAPVPQLVHGLLASRRAVEALLAEAESIPGGLDRAVVHPSLGRLTVDQIVSKYVVGHEAEHIAQIEALKAVVAVPQAVRP
jgi:hypothetical protein